MNDSIIAYLLNLDLYSIWIWDWKGNRPDLDDKIYRYDLQQIYLTSYLLVEYVSTPSPYRVVCIIPSSSETDIQTDLKQTPPAPTYL